MQNKHHLIHSLVASGMIAGLALNVQNLRAEDTSARNAVKLPFIVYDENGSSNNHYIASGWMGNAKATKMAEDCTTNPHGGKTCLRVEYSESANWSGVVWQDPANDWGDQAGGYNLTGAKVIKFWARGEKGGETASFKFGVLGTDKKFSDSSSGNISEVKLTKEWTEYTIDLAEKDLTHIKTGFVWTVEGQGTPVVFFLDDIRYE